MCKFLKINALMALLFITFSASAQNGKFYKGEFEGETPNTAISANLDLYAKTIDGGGEETGKCFGTIEIASERGITGFDVIEVNYLELDGAEPSIIIVPWDFPDIKEKVSIMGLPEAGTLNLDSWDKDYSTFKNVTLKKMR